MNSREYFKLAHFPHLIHCTYSKLFLGADPLSGPVFVGISDFCVCSTFLWTLFTTPKSSLQFARPPTTNQLHQTTIWTLLFPMMTSLTKMSCDSHVICNLYVHFISINSDKSILLIPIMCTCHVFACGLCV